MVGFVTGHHLVAGDAVEHGVHDRPLRRGFAPAAFGFLARQFHDSGDAKVAMQSAAHDEDAAPDDVARFGNAFERAAAKAARSKALPNRATSSGAASSS